MFRTAIRGSGEAGKQVVHICVSLRQRNSAQTSYNNHADNQDEDPAALQDETYVLSVGL
jgi:hypothetical protein